MAYNTESLLVDDQGKPIPQWYNPVTGKYEPFNGDYSGAYMQLKAPLPAGANIIGFVKLSDGTDALAINTNGSINAVPVNAAGTEYFTAGNPGTVNINTIPEVEIKNDSGNPLAVSVGKTFDALPSATPIYIICGAANQLFYVTECSTAGIVTGQKTIGTTALEIYAGASNRLANRYILKITSDAKNTANAFIGASGVLTTTGDILYPGDTAIIEFTL